jgi:CRP-like cAMP-binding protein
VSKQSGSPSDEIAAGDVAAAEGLLGEGGTQALLAPKAVEAGGVLIRQGAPSETLFLVASGELDVELENAGAKVALGAKRMGDWVGELGMIRPGPASATVRARRATRVWSIPHATYLDLLETQPRAMGAALGHIASDLARRIRRSRDAHVAPDRSALERVLAHLKELEGVDRTPAPAAPAPKRAHAKTMPTLDGEALMRTLDGLGLFRAADAREQARAEALRKALAGLAMSSFSVQTYLDGESVCEAGERADGVFVLLAGSARVEVGQPGSALHSVATLSPGALFGHQAFLDDNLRQADVRSVGASVVAVLWPSAVEELLRQGQAGSPGWLPVMDWFAQSLVADARALNRRLVQTLSAPPAKRG